MPLVLGTPDMSNRRETIVGDLKYSIYADSCFAFFQLIVMPIIISRSGDLAP